jgi:PhnB protein
MTTASIYLNYNGNCEEAFNFYKGVFGTEFSYISRFGEMPESELHRISEADREKIMHVSLPIGNTVLMGSDTGGEWAPSFVLGNNFSISLNASSKDEADKWFDALSQGGTITMPMDNTFWGDYFGMICDRFGVNWMISFNEQHQ